MEKVEMGEIPGRLLKTKGESPSADLLVGIKPDPQIFQDGKFRGINIPETEIDDVFRRIWLPDEEIR